MNLRQVVILLCLLTMIKFGASDEDSSSVKPRVRLRRPLKRVNQNSLKNVTTNISASSVSSTRSRFRIKANTPKSDTTEVDQVSEGSKTIVSRVKPNVKAASPKSSSGYKIVCYYTNWSQYRPKVGKFLPEDIDPTLCTHIIFAFGWMKKGKLSSFEATDESKDGKIGFYEKINNLKKVNPKLKTLLAIGGWSFGTAKFKEMSATRYSRQIFVFSCIPYLRERNFDGLDLDWEYPKGSDDKKNFVLLLKELREAFLAEAEETGKPRLLLSAAVPVGPDSIRGGYDVPEVNKNLDFINLMAYDFHGKWESQTGHNAPLYAPSSDSEWRKQLSVDNAAKTWVKLGATKDKLVIGMPTYGRSFILADKRNYTVNVASKGGGTAGVYTKESGFLSYYEICEILQSGNAIYVWDNEMKVPYLVSDDQWVGFDDERSIRNKMKWIKSEGYAGAMVWTVDMDDFTGTVCPGKQKYPLIGAMREELLGEKRSGNDVDWSSLVPTPDDLNNDAAQSLSPEKIDIKEVFAAANKKQLKPFIQNIEPKTRPPAVMCFVTNWSDTRRGYGRFIIEDVDPKLCTHIVYAFAKLKDNKLSPGNETDAEPNGPYSRLFKLKEVNPDLKILVSLGGWAHGSTPFEQLVSNVYRMNNFVYSATEFLREHQFDGLDVDWEYPTGKSGKESYLNFIRELRMAFEGEAKLTKEPRLILTISVPAAEEAIKSGYAVPELSEVVDYFNVMTYDLHGQWEKTVGHNAPLHPIDSDSATLTVSHAAGVWVRLGAPREKMIIGMPTYGRTFTLENPEKFDIGAAVVSGGKQGEWTREKGFLAYYEVCDFLQLTNTTLVWDNEQSVPFAYNGDQWVGFDDERSFRSKTEWLRSESFGGVMVWSVDLDDFKNHCGTGKFPLLQSIVDDLKEYAVTLLYKGPYEGTGGGKSGGKKDPNEVVCQEEDGHISYHPDKADCSKYYMCEGERKHHMPCPANLVFNPDQNVCDWAENVEGCMMKENVASV